MNEAVESWLMRRAFMSAPHEACGFVMKDDSIIEIPNASIDPHNSFAMSRYHLNSKIPNPELIEAIWHTHPSGSIYPSPGDLDMMAVCQWRYLIVTKTQVAEYPLVPQHDSFWAAFSA